MSIYKELIGKRIKAVRKEKGISQAELAFRLNLSPNHLSRLENGHQFMAVETLINIANELGITTDVLLADCLDGPDEPKDSLNEVLKDCSKFERKVILDCARFLKETLRKNDKMRNND